MNAVGKFTLKFIFTAFLFSLLPVQAQEPKSPIGVLKPLIDSKSLAGAVTLVADKDKVLSHETIGYADVGAQRPMLLDMIFWIASMSKPITAVGLMMVVDEGKVNLDDPIDGQVALSGRSRTDRIGIVRIFYVEGLAVGLRVNRDGLDVQFATGPGDSNGDFAAIGD